MKRRFSSAIILTLAILVTFTVQVPAQEKKPDTAIKKHIKIVTIKNGEKVETDTIISEGDVQVFDVGKDKKFRWVSAGQVNKADSLAGGTEYRFDTGKGNKVIVMKRGGGKEPVIIREEETVGDSGKIVTVHVESAEPGGGNFYYFTEGDGSHSRMIPFGPGARAVQNKRERGNVINLADPDVISFKKKKMSGDREKIIVIRKQVKESDVVETMGYPDFRGEELKKMNEPRVVREFEIQKREPGKPVEKRVEIRTIPEPEKK